LAPLGQQGVVESAGKAPPPPPLQRGGHGRHEHAQPRRNLWQHGHWIEGAGASRMPEVAAVIPAASDGRHLRNGAARHSFVWRYNPCMRPRRPRLTRTLNVVVALYVLALAAMPFAHHDLACHLKSNT